MSVLWSVFSCFMWLFYRRMLSSIRIQRLWKLYWTKIWVHLHSV